MIGQAPKHPQRETSAPLQLVERHLELEAMACHLRDAGVGSGRLLLLSGEAGVGKTALLTRFLHLLPASTPHMAGNCDPLDTPRPLGPLFDISRHLGDEVRRHLQRGRRDDVFAAFLEDLRRDPGSRVVAFEDIHWADASTLDLLRFLAARLGTTRTLVIATLRSDELTRGHPLTTALGDLARMGAVRRLPVRCLSPNGVRVLADGRHPDPAQLHRVTGGNPFFVTEVLASGPGRVPETVRDAVRARVSRLTPAAQAVLDVAAVIGGPALPALLSRLSGGGLDAVDECLEHGIFEATEEGCRFRHELARITVWEAVPAGRRAGLHAAVLAALRSGPFATSDPSVLAHHAIQSGDAVAVLELGPAAATHAAQLSSHREAAAHLATTLRFGGDLAPSERARLLERQAHHCYLTGRGLEDAIAACEEALALRAAAGDRVEQAIILSLLYRLRWMTGQEDKASAAALSAFEVLERRPEGLEMARILGELAMDCSMNGAADEAISLAEQASALAETVGDTEALAVGHLVIGATRIDADEERGKALVVHSMELARASGREDLELGGYLTLQTSAAVRRRLDEADGWLQRGVQRLSKPGQQYLAVLLANSRSLTALYRGSWQEAVELAAESREGPLPVFRVLPNVVLGTVLARRGDSAAWAHLDRALDEADGAGPLRKTVIYAARAEAAFLAGDLACAADEAREGLAAAGSHASPWMLGELAYWYRMSTGSEPAVAGVAEPYALQRVGSWRLAAERWRALGCPYEAARCLLDSDSEEVLRSAHQALDQIGALATARLAAERLRVKGVRSLPRGRRPATRANPLGLTPRQQEILEFVGLGLTDAAIGARLHLSRKTVSHHVSAILTKLGVETRQAAARVQAQGR